MMHKVKSIRFYVNDRKDRAAEVRDMLAPVAAAAGLDVMALLLINTEINQSLYLSG